MQTFSSYDALHAAGLGRAISCAVGDAMLLEIRVGKTVYFMRQDNLGAIDVEDVIVAGERMNVFYDSDLKVWSEGRLLLQ
jgi:arginyl-tRNA--protein-N-Asp/Glu arginylyltransferase